MKMLAGGSSIAYVRTTCGNAKTLFAEAVRRRADPQEPIGASGIRDNGGEERPVCHR